MQHVHQHGDRRYQHQRRYHAGSQTGRLCFRRTKPGLNELVQHHEGDRGQRKNDARPVFVSGQGDPAPQDTKSASRGSGEERQSSGRRRLLRCQKTKNAQNHTIGRENAGHFLAHCTAGAVWQRRVEAEARFRRNKKPGATRARQVNDPTPIASGEIRKIRRKRQAHHCDLLRCSIA